MVTVDGRLLLVIDDDSTDRMRIIRWLGHRFAICEAATAQVGLDMARRLRPGCVLLDYRLTDASGLDVLDDLVRGDFSVVVLTGQGDEEVAVRAIKAGAVDYLVKDRVTQEEMSASVTTALVKSAGQRHFGEPGRELHGFGDLVSDVLRPRLSKVSLACAEAIRSRPELREILDPAVETLIEIDEHVAGLRTFAEIDDLCARTESVDLAEIGERVMTALGDAERVPRVRLELGGLPIVNGSKEALERLLYSLARCAARNAARADDPTVTIGAELTGGVWQVVVEDNGAPPSAAELSREVFLPYRRGTGRSLDFAVAALIVRRHGGEIWIEGREPDGCRVTFSLPFVR